MGGRFGGFLRGARAAAAILFLGAACAADIEQTYIIPLKTFAYSVGGSEYYKYGIHVGIGGGSARVFEFDTGGEGFYAAYSGSSPWWGGDVTLTSDAFTKQFGSGITYTGNVARAGLAFYDESGTSLILNTGSTEFKVGAADTITQGSSTLWPNGGHPPPVEDHFFGDFGLTLKKGAHGIENVFAQLTYGNGITAGYIVSLGPYGRTYGASVQVGLSSADLTNPNTTWFTMQGQDTNVVFTGSGLPTYSAELLQADMTLTFESTTHTFEGLGINLDTGNPTPGLDFNASDRSTLEPFSDLDSAIPVSLKNGVHLELVSDPIGAAEPPLTIYSLNTGSDYGQNFVYEKERSDGGVTYLNVGALLFQQYDVTFDLENGRLGLTPTAVPAPGPLGLTLFGLSLLVFAKLMRAGPPFVANVFSLRRWIDSAPLPEPAMRCDASARVDRGVGRSQELCRPFPCASRNFVCNYASLAGLVAQR